MYKFHIFIFATFLKINIFFYFINKWNIKDQKILNINILPLQNLEDQLQLEDMLKQKEEVNWKSLEN